MRNHRQIEKMLLNLYREIEVVGGVECQTAPDNFYPEDFVHHGKSGSNLTQTLAIEGAKAICKDCPVKNLCLSYALAARETHGIWGGLTAPERQLLVRLQD